MKIIVWAKAEFEGISSNSNRDRDRDIERVEGHKDCSRHKPKLRDLLLVRKLQF